MSLCMHWILIINSQPLHKELEVTSSTIQAGLRKEAIICFLIFCVMSHHVMQEPLCEEIRLQKQVHHVIRCVFNNWCHAGAISCETVPSEDSLVFKSLSGYAQVFNVTTLLLFAFVVTVPFAPQHIFGLVLIGKEDVVNQSLFLMCNLIICQSLSGVYSRIVLTWVAAAVQRLRTALFTLRQKGDKVNCKVRCLHSGCWIKWVPTHAC